ncbi:anthranilate synthase component II [Hippea maritima]|uniref:Glutamine amidotransferase of anthranilate synthase n=1 Tax=Hippea maritima (strain ATCC 700847 / DSM 10411 / MH2) TaxID=760142 RepID=F2LU54_HIPMA|nr:aminodeoxychorismate/anthranilate synthase component II [Hippea maritima]AEA34517.1 glutamine amidotransferase of anthranilate synthase [Hippea maritima DSM 10411]
MIALIDNYDSFTYNLSHYIGLFDDVVVIRNTEKTDKLKSIKNLKGIAISPGPSHPKNSLLSLEVIDVFKGKTPIFGVCLGMQAIGLYFGFSIEKANRIMHGKTDKIKHFNSEIFSKIRDEFIGVRYHSLVVKGEADGFNITAVSVSDNQIMAIENKALRIYGVQFHPESYLSQFGLQIVKNFVKGVCNVN